MAKDYRRLTGAFVALAAVLLLGACGEQNRYVLVVNGDNVVEQRKVGAGQTVGEMRVIDSGLKPDDRVVVAGLIRAIPGEKVDPQLQTASAAPAAK